MTKPQDPSLREAIKRAERSRMRVAQANPQHGRTSPVTDALRQEAMMDAMLMQAHATVVLAETLAMASEGDDHAIYIREAL